MTAMFHEMVVIGMSMFKGSISFGLTRRRSRARQWAGVRHIIGY